MPPSPWKRSEHPLPGMIVSSFLFVFQLTYLPPPWGECRSSEMGLDFFPVYSITACRIDCETRYIVENCNCRMVHMPGGCQSPQDLWGSHPDRKQLTHSWRMQRNIVLGRLWYLTTKGRVEIFCLIHQSEQHSGWYAGVPRCVHHLHLHAPYACQLSVPLAS